MVQFFIWSVYEQVYTTAVEPIEMSLGFSLFILNEVFIGSIFIWLGF